jgi:hypothetical protein
MSGGTLNKMYGTTWENAHNSTWTLGWTDSSQSSNDVTQHDWFLLYPVTLVCARLGWSQVCRNPSNATVAFSFDQKHFYNHGLACSCVLTRWEPHWGKTSRIQRNITHLTVELCCEPALQEETPDRILPTVRELISVSNLTPALCYSFSAAHYYWQNFSSVKCCL